MTYRFRRGADIVDVLAPDHLGPRANTTTVPPDRTLEAVGGRQALNRRRAVLVDAGDGLFELPLPSLIGAIVIKARVTANAAGTREKHQRDLARLLVLIADPAATRSELNRKERGYLRARTELLNLEHPAWRGIGRAQDGVLALEILAE